MMIKKQPRMGKLTLSAIGVSALLVLSACSSDNTADEPAAANDSDSAVAEGAPVAETEVASTETAVQPEAVAQPEPEEMATEPEVLTADAGAKLYESNCKVCHDAGLLNAPKYGDAAAWAPRLAKDKETLYTHSAKGFNKMPAQAVDGITEAQVKAAVDYMLASVS